MTLLRTFCVTLCSAGLSGLHAATPVALQPYLEYPPIQTRVGQSAGFVGMSHAVLVMDLDANKTDKRTPSIIVSEYGGSPNSVVAFNGATGQGINGWESGKVRPIGNWAGPAYLSGSAEPYPRIFAAFESKPALIVSEYGEIIGSFSRGNLHSSAMAIGGNLQGSRRDFVSAYYGGEDYKVHRVSLFTLDEWPGWPKGHFGGQRVTTPVLLDINRDKSPEVFSAAGSSSAGFQVKAHDGASGNLLWERQVTQGYVANYLAIGQVRPDEGLEVIVIERTATSPFTPTVLIWDAATGANKATINLPGTVRYGTTPVLADLNGDGLDEVVVATESFLSAIDGLSLQQLPGFPASLGNVWIHDSAPVIGDIGGAPGAEIVLTTQVPGSSSSQVHIISQNGTYMIPRQSMVLGGGMTNAIHNLDDDGHNELVIGARGAPVVGLQDSVWVFDFSRDELLPSVHGEVLWGQFGQNAERCNCSRLALKQVTDIPFDAGTRP
jgi:hypothetical protein